VEEGVSSRSDTGVACNVVRGRENGNEDSETELVKQIASVGPHFLYFSKF
jgi:hypothetical protein